MRSTTLRPGLLVSLKTSVRGGVEYQRVDIEQEHTTETGEKRARWETTRTVEDAAEYELAAKVRSKCRNTIVSVCAQSEFGLLCPLTREKQLEAAIDEARILADVFNRDAKRSQVSVYVITGRVAYDDVEAARAIGSEVRELLETMQAGIAAADPEKIREAAARAKNLGAMLSDEAQGKVTAAVEQAREAAREIAKRVTKAGEVAATVVAELKTDQIAKARFTFLDLDGERKVEALPVQGRGIDLAPEQGEAGAACPETLLAERQATKIPELEV